MTQLQLRPVTSPNAHCLVFSLSFVQTGTFTALPGALEIAGSFRPRRQQAHHPQPVDEGQRSHQGELFFEVFIVASFYTQLHLPAVAFLPLSTPAEVGGE